MDAFLITAIVVLLAETGDRPQLLSAALAMRYRRVGALLAGLAIAALANAALSAAAGAGVNALIGERPLQLFYAMALLFAGAGMVWRQRPVDLLEKWKTGPFWTALAGLFILAFGNKSQFVIAAAAARTGDWPLALAGGWCGTMAACVPAILLREKLADMLPLVAIRRVAGALFILIGAVMALRAWGLVA